MIQLTQEQVQGLWTVLNELEEPITIELNNEGVVFVTCHGRQEPVFYRIYLDGKVTEPTAL